MPPIGATTPEYPCETVAQTSTDVVNVSVPTSGIEEGKRMSSLVLPTSPIRASILARHDSLHLTSEVPETVPPSQARRTSRNTLADEETTDDDMDDLLFPAMNGSLHSDANDRRMPSLSVVRLDEDQRSPEHTGSSAAQKSIDVRPEGRLRAPNASSHPSRGLSERVTFVNEQYQIDPPNGRYPVHLHVYDLSGGLLGKYAKELTGIEEEGVFHSAITCFGMEFYFEGGIGMAPAGRTRFGPKFEVVELGTTVKSLPQFLEWTKIREEAAYRLHDYHPVRHNCHHFNEEAAEFLLERHDDDVIPLKLFTTTEHLVKTDTGAPALEALLLTTFGIQLSLARMLRSRAFSRQLSQDMLVSASAACGVLSLPPPAIVVFRVLDTQVCRATLLQLTPFLVRVYRGSIRTRNEGLKIIAELVSCLLEGSSTLLEEHSKGFTELTAQCLQHTPLSFWGPLLDSLRVALLNKTILATVAYHEDMVPLLLNGCRDFPRLQPDGRLGMLRVLCNLCCAGLGAAVLVDTRYQGTIVATIGLGLLDANPMVVYTAACLASNMSLAVCTSPNPALQREMSQMGDTHPALRLLTILLYQLRHRSSCLDEASRNMVITAVMRIMSANLTALQFVSTTPFRLQYIPLLRQCSTNESRSCLCIMKALEDLFA